MMKRPLLVGGLGLLLSLSACVSKKKYVDLEDRYETSQKELYKRNAENEEYKDKLDRIQDQVDNYYAKINALRDDNSYLSDENAKKLELKDGIAMSRKVRQNMEEVLKN